MEKKEGEGKVSFFKRKSSRKAPMIQEAPVPDNAQPGNHLSTAAKSSTLPLNRHDHGAHLAVSHSSSEGLFSKLKRRFKLRSSRGKYDLKDFVPQVRVRRKSDDPNTMKEGREEECGELRATLSVKTPRRTQTDKEDVILIRKNKRVSVMCKTGDNEPEVIFSNVVNMEDDEESFGECGDEDPYATINSVKEEINEKFKVPDTDGQSEGAERLENKRLKARELLSQSTKRPSDTMGASPVEKMEDLYAKIKPKKKDSKSQNVKLDEIVPTTSSSPEEDEDITNLNRLCPARLKNRLEPEYETLEDVRQRSSVMYGPGDNGYEDISQVSSSVCTEGPDAEMALDPDYETLDDVQQKIKQSFPSSSTSNSKHDSCSGNRKQSASSSHYSKPFDADSKSSKSKLSGSVKSTSVSSFSTNDMSSPVEGSVGSREDSKSDGYTTVEGALLQSQALSAKEEKVNDSGLIPSDNDSCGQQSAKNLAPLASCVDSTLPTEESVTDAPKSPENECIYDNPNVILRKQINRHSLSPVSPRNRRSCLSQNPRTPAEEELVEKLSSLLAPPLPLRNYTKEEVSRGVANSRHSWASPSPKFWDMSESWHGSDFGKAGNSTQGMASLAGSRMRNSAKSKSQELFEGGRAVQKSPSTEEKPEEFKDHHRHERTNGDTATEPFEGRTETARSLSPQFRIIPVIKSPGLVTATKGNAAELCATPPCRILPISVLSSSSSSSPLHSPDESQSRTKDIESNRVAVELVESLRRPDVSHTGEREVDVDFKKSSEEICSVSPGATMDKLKEDKEVDCSVQGSQREVKTDDKMSRVTSSTIVELEGNNTGLISMTDDQKGLSGEASEVSEMKAEEVVVSHAIKGVLSPAGALDSSDNVEMVPESSVNGASSPSLLASPRCIEPRETATDDSTSTSNSSHPPTDSLPSSVQCPSDQTPPAAVPMSSVVRGKFKPSPRRPNIHRVNDIQQSRDNDMRQRDNGVQRRDPHDIDEMDDEDLLHVNIRQRQSNSSRIQPPPNSREHECNLNERRRIPWHSQHRLADQYDGGLSSSSQQAEGASRAYMKARSFSRSRPDGNLNQLTPTDNGALASSRQGRPARFRRNRQSGEDDVSSSVGSNGLNQRRMQWDDFYAREMDSSEDSDPLGDLELYNENALYWDDESDDFEMWSERRRPSRIQRLDFPDDLPPPKRRKNRSFGYDDDDSDGDNEFDRVVSDRNRSLPQSYWRRMYPYSSYQASDFDCDCDWPQEGEDDIGSILLARPILLENIINGHFCPFIGVNPYYMSQGTFQWSRIFSLPPQEMGRVERKLFNLYHRYHAVVVRGKSRKTDEDFCSDSQYWAVVDYLKGIQDQPTFLNIRMHLLGTDKLLKFKKSFEKNCSALPLVLNQIMEVDLFMVGREEFDLNREMAPCRNALAFSPSTHRKLYCGRQGLRTRTSTFQTARLKVSNEKQGYEGEGPSGTDVQNTKQANQLSPGSTAHSVGMLSEFHELSDARKLKFKYRPPDDDDDDSDEDDEEEAVDIYIKQLNMAVREVVQLPDETNVSLSFCRALRGELAYTARLRKSGVGKKNKLSSWRCTGMDSHLSFSAWEEMDQLMRKLVPHMSPRLDFQFLLRLYFEFKFSILKDRQRNKQRRGCFFVEFGHGAGCCKKEEFVFLKMLRDELCYFSHVIRASPATEALFMEEHSVAYSLTRLLNLVLEAIWKMKLSIRESSSEERDEKEEQEDTGAAPWKRLPEPFSQNDDFDTCCHMALSWSCSIIQRMRFHLANYRCFRTSTMWLNLQKWEAPNCFLNDPNLLQRNSSVFTHADNAIHVAQFGGYEDPKPLQDGEGFTESMQQLRQKEWYWGPLSYEQATLVLKDHNDGTFLVRDSSDNRYLLSLSFISLGEVHHTRIEHAKGLFSFWSQPDSHTKGNICEFIDVSVQNSKDGRFLYFLRPSARGTPPIPIRLLYGLSRNFRVPSLKHLSRLSIRHSTRIDLIRTLPVPQKIKSYILEKQYFVEIHLDDQWAFEREGSVPA